MQLKENSLLQNGRYKITKVIGQGGFGITYLALSHETLEGNIGKFDVEVPVAIKEFFVKDSCTRNDNTTDVETIGNQDEQRIAILKKQFIKEAQNMSKLNHPNINKVKDVFEENGTVYYVMQYLKGGSLKELVQEQGTFSEQKAIRYIRQIASALRYMHSQRTCHLDVKPANIMLNEHDEAVLIDFGIAKHYEKNGDETAESTVGVSEGFAPIEQYQSSLQEFSPTTDIYGLAATLYFLIIGTTPPDAYSILERGLGRRPDNISERTWLAIVQGMQPVRTQRVKSIDEFLSILDGIWSKSTADDTSVSYIPKSAEQETYNRRHIRNMVIGLLSCLLVGVIVLLIGHLSRDRHEIVENKPYTDRNGEQYQYSGQWLDEKPDGKGKAIYPDGRHYEGRFKKGLKNDKAATFTDRKGSVFTGTYKADTIVKGKIQIAGDDYIFEGTFSQDKPYNGIWYDQDHNQLVKVINGKEV